MLLEAAKMIGSDLKGRLHEKASEVWLWPCRDVGEGLTDLPEALLDRGARDRRQDAGPEVQQELARRVCRAETMTSSIFAGGACGALRDSGYYAVPSDRR
jgi:hypothetical protein